MVKCSEIPGISDAFLSYSTQCYRLLSHCSALFSPQSSPSMSYGELWKGLNQLEFGEHAPGWLCTSWFLLPWWKSIYYIPTASHQGLLPYFDNSSLLRLTTYIQLSKLWSPAIKRHLWLTWLMFLIISPIKMKCHTFLIFIKCLAKVIKRVNYEFQADQGPFHKTHHNYSLSNGSPLSSTLRQLSMCPL